MLWHLMKSRGWVHSKFQTFQKGQSGERAHRVFMQTHEWMRRRQQPRNGNRGEDRFRPRFYYLWFSYKNSTLYIHTDCVYAQYSAHTHVRQSEPSCRIYRAEASGKPWVQTPHQLSSIVCIPSTWGSSSRRTPSIYILSYATKNVKKSVMRLTFLLCCRGRCTAHSFRVNAIGFALVMSCL